MRIRWQENGIVLTAFVAVAVGGFIALERSVANRAQSPILIAIEVGADSEDENEEHDPASSATVPLFDSLAELNERAHQLLAEPKPPPDLLHELARQARGFRAYALADSLLAQCLTLAPERVDSLFLRARTQSDLGHPEQAVEMYEAVLARSPNHQKATYNLGVVSRRAGEWERAELLLTRAIAISSGRIKAKALHQLGLTHSSTGRWDSAAQFFTEAVGLRPDARRYWLDLGNAEQKRGRLDEAQVAFEKALALNGRAADAHAALGLLLEERGNSAGALSHLTRAIKLDDANSDYRKALARHYFAQRNTSMAREAFGWLSLNAGTADRAYADVMLALLGRDTERLLAQLKQADALLTGDYDDALEQAAIFLHEQKRYGDARALLDKLVARPSPSADVLLSGARTASRLEQWVDAETLLRRSLESRPESSEAWFQLGRVLSERGDLDGAIDAYRSSLERNPGARNTRLNLAVLYARSGDEGEALALYEQLLQSHPRYTPALVNRARLHERAGRVAEAVADLEAAMRVAPPNSDTGRALAQLLFRQGENDRALALLSDAVTEAPADPELRLLLAEAELRAGRRADALKDLNRAAALAGDDQHLWSQLAQRYRELDETAAAAQAEFHAGRVASPRVPSNESH